MSNRTLTIEIPVAVLAIDSNYDAITKLAFNYRQNHLYPYFIDRGFLLEKCQGKLARRHYVVQTLNNLNVNIEYITGVGHGFDDMFTGDQGSPIFSINNYSYNESQGKIIHFLSCYSAIKLGVDLVKNGCLAFFGYDIPFTYIIDCDQAEVLWECDSEIDRSFADDLTAEQVYQRVDSLYETRIKEYKEKLRQARKSDEDEIIIQQLQNIICYLKVHRNHLCCPSVDQRWGNIHSKLS